MQDLSLLHHQLQHQPLLLLQEEGVPLDTCPRLIVREDGNPCSDMVILIVVTRIAVVITCRILPAGRGLRPVLDVSAHRMWVVALPIPSGTRCLHQPHLVLQAAMLTHHGHR